MFMTIYTYMPERKIINTTGESIQLFQQMTKGKKTLSEFNLKIPVQVPSLTVSLTVLCKTNAKELHTLQTLADKKHFNVTKRTFKHHLLPAKPWQPRQQPNSAARFVQLTKGQTWLPLGTPENKESIHSPQSNVLWP